MYNQIYSNLMHIFNNEVIELPEIEALFRVDTLEDVIDIVIDYFNDYVDEIVFDDTFTSMYHLFLYHLCDIVSDNEDLYKIKELTDNNIRTIKKCLLIYNKSDMKKDALYHSLEKVKNLLEVNQYHLKVYIENTKEKEDYLVLRFMIDKLKNPDYLFRIFQLHPDYVNIKNQDGNHLFYMLVEYYLSELKNMEEEDRKYYKRIFIMLLESDELSLTNDELNDILKMCKINESGNDNTFNKDIDFIINAIKLRYKVLNGGFRENSHDHIGIIVPPTILIPDTDGRKDFTNQFIISIDTPKHGKLEKLLIDDTFSLNMDAYGNYYLYIHIPDVDLYIPRTGEIEDFMRGIGESVYAKDMKTPLLSYEIADKCSLKMGDKKPALSFLIKIDQKGNILDTRFYKSIIRVNYNLTASKANTFFINNSDERLNILNPMYELASKLRRKRGERIGNRQKAQVIMDEFNIIADLATALYFNDRGIVFPYKNYKGKKTPVLQEHIEASEEFIRTNNISEGGRELINSIFDINNRVYYDTVNHGNTAFGGRPSGNVGNPMREYISLETDRLIKDLIIDKMDTVGYWEERIERDCIEYTEVSAKIKELYIQNSKKRR